MMDKLLTYLPVIIFVAISLIATFFLDCRKYFERLRRIHYVFTVICFVFPFIDIIQTQIFLSLNMEGNVAVITIISSLPEGYGWGIFVIAHILFSVVTLFLGWQGRNEKKEGQRAAVFAFGLFLTFLITWNFLGMLSYGIM